MDDKKFKEITEAIYLLRTNGYYVTRITEDMEERMNDCAENECSGVDCFGCCCNICLLHD